MSNQQKHLEKHCDVTSGCGAIKLIITPHKKDLGGFSVRRSLPSKEQQMIGPWIFFDHMGPAEFAPGEGINVRPHPHVNLATVSYLFEGEILHRDSLGNKQPIRPGDVNLMVAGKGIVHSERERPEVTSSARRLHGLQLWLALPKTSEEIEPAFYHYPSTDIPQVDVEGVPVRVIIGKAYDTQSPVKTYSDTLYIEARLSAGQRLTLPNAVERALYVVSGSLKARDTLIPAHTMITLQPNENVTVEASEDTFIALIGGDPFDKRYMEWNFISSRKERIEQAKSDWVGGNFPLVPGDEEEFIPLPE